MKISYLLFLLLFANIACVPALVDNEESQEVPVPSFEALDFNHTLFKSKASNRTEGTSKNAATAAYRLELAHSYFSEYVEVEVSIFNELANSIKNFNKSEVSTVKYISSGEYNGEFTLTGELLAGFMNWEMTYKTSGSEAVQIMNGTNDGLGKIINWKISSPQSVVHTVSAERIEDKMEVSFLSNDSKEDIKVSIEKTEKINLVEFSNLYSQFSVALDNETSRGYLEERNNKICWDENLNNAICN